MKRTLTSALSFVIIAVLIGVIGCQDQVVEPSDSQAEGYLQSDSPSDQDVLSKNSLPANATVMFGRNEIGSPFPPPEGHDASTHAKDALQPRTVVISAGGQVTFQVATFHKIAIYDDGTQPGDIDVTSLDGSGLPIAFPPIINDPANRIARGDLVFPAPVDDFTWTFNEPGRYLVICEVLPHFAENGMYGWVIVK